MSEEQQVITNSLEEDQVYRNAFDGFLRPSKPVYSNTEAALRKATLSSDKASAWLDSLEKGSSVTHQEIIATATEENEHSLATAVEQMTIDTGTPPSPEDILQIQEESSFSRETGPEDAWLSQLEGSENLSDEDYNRIKMRRWTQRKIAEIADDMGLFDTLADIGGLMLVPDETYNHVDYANKILGTKSSVEGVFNNPDVIWKMGQAYQQLSPEEQVEAFKVMAEAAHDVEDDNQLQQVLMLMASTGSIPEEEIRFGQVMDQLTIAGVVGKALSSILRGTRILKDVGAVGDIRSAADLADAAAKGDKIPAEIGVSRIDAASSTLPTTTGDLAKLLDQAPEGISSKIRNEFATMDLLRGEALDFPVENVRTILEENPAEFAKVLEKYKANVIEENPNLENLTITNTTDGVIFDFDILEKGIPAGTEDQLLHKSKSIVFSEKDISTGFNQKEVTLMGDLTSWLYSPNKLLAGDRNLLVQGVERLSNAQAKVRSKLTDSLRIATKDLDKVGKQNVSKILLKGDEEDIVYSYHQLTKEGIGGIKLTDKEYAGYLKVRKALDDLYILKNDEIRSAKAAKGEKLIDLGVDSKKYGTPYEDISTAISKYNSDTDFKKVYDPLADSFVSEMTSERLHHLYEKGFRLTRINDSSDFFFFKKTPSKWALIDKSKISDLPGSILRYKPGYVPRIYEDAYWFVRKKKATVEGHPITGAVRYFDNRTDALKFIDDEVAAGRARADDFLEPRFDREPLTGEEAQADIINSFGGLFGSSRGQEALKFGIKGEKAKFKDPLEALQRYVFHLGNRIPVNQYKLGLQEKWMQSASELLGQRPTGGFRQAIGDINKVTDTVKQRQKKLLQKQWEQIDGLSAIPSADDQRLQGKFISIGMAMEKADPRLKGAASYMYSLTQKNPIGATKAATHHMLLGMYNMVQFPVQALGASVAFSINPTYAAKGAPKWLAFSYLDNIIDPINKAKVMKSLAGKMDGLSDLEETYRLWQRSGYRESVLVTNGDYAALSNGLPYDGNLIKRLFDKGTIFFKAGELANMRISFATALERWKDLNKGKPITDRALKEIMSRAEQYRLNMGQGNKAAFQKGMISVPLQFQQINTKFMEAIGVSDHFTPKERMRLLMGQGLLFGAMGIPLGEKLASWVVDATDTPVESMSSEFANTVKRGLTGLLFNNMLGIDAEISGRVGIASGLTDMATDMIFEQHDLLGLLGPAGSVAERFKTPWEAITLSGKFLWSAEDLSVEDIGKIGKNISLSLAEVPSSTRNAVMAAVLWDSGLVRSKINGKVLWTEDPDLASVLFQAVGFQSMTKQEYYELLKSEKERGLTEKHLVDTLDTMYQRMLRGYEDHDPEKAKAAALTIGILNSMIKEPTEAVRIQKQLTERYKQKDDRRELIERAILNYSDFATPSEESFNILLREATE